MNQTVAIINGSFSDFCGSFLYVGKAALQRPNQAVEQTAEHTLLSDTKFIGALPPLSGSFGDSRRYHATRSRR